jgi:hypothetical protein
VSRSIIVEKAASEAPQRTGHVQEMAHGGDASDGTVGGTRRLVKRRRTPAADRDDGRPARRELNLVTQLQRETYDYEKRLNGPTFQELVLEKLEVSIRASP